MTSSPEAASRSQVIDLEALRAKLPELSAAYAAGSPVPHIAFEDFLNPAIVADAIAEFPDTDSDEWKAYAHVNERKFSNTDPESWGPTLRSILDALNSDDFVAFVSELTGIEGMFADPTLEGGGLHQSMRGGYLNVHADFTVHPLHQNWRRRVNILVYFNEDWDPSWGGDLELWSRDMKTCGKKVAPIANRSVIFTTEADTFHGHPEPMTLPEGRARRSLALYYFSVDDHAVVQSTEYRARPSDGNAHGFAIWADKHLLRAFDWSKRHLGVSDDQARKVLDLIDRLKGSRSKG